MDGCIPEEEGKGECPLCWPKCDPSTSFIAKAKTHMAKMGKKNALREGKKLAREKWSPNDPKSVH